MERIAAPPQSLDVVEVARRTRDNVRALLSAERTSLFRLDPTGRRLTRVRDEPGASGASESVSKAHLETVRTAIRERRLVIRADLEAPPGPGPGDPSGVEEATHRTGVALPFVVDDRVLGGLLVELRPDHLPTPQDVELLRALADDAAQAMESARLYEETDRARREADVIADLARSLNESLDPAVVLQRVADAARDLCGADTGRIALREAGRDELTMRYGAGGPDHFGALRIRPGQGAAGLVLQTGRPLRSDNYALDPRISKDYLEEVTREGLVTVMAVPIRSAETVEGVLLVYNRTTRAFTDRDEAVLLRLAHHAAGALYNAGRHQEARQRLRELETLLAVSVAVGSTLDTTETMRRVAREAAHALDADMVGAYLVTADGAALRPVAGYHVPAELRETVLSHPIPVHGNGLVEEAWAQHRPAWSSHCEGDPRVPAQILQHASMRSMLFAPMGIGGRLAGGLFAVWWRRERDFSAAEIRLVDGISRQAALSLDNARLHEATDQARREAQVVAELARTINASLDIDIVLQRVAEAAKELCDADGSRIALVDPESGEMVFCQVVGMRWSGWQGFHVGTSQGVGGRVLMSGRPVRLDDYADEPSLTEKQRWLVHEEGLQTVLCVPIRSADRLEGVLFVDRREPRPFTERDESVGMHLAEQAATAIRNARTFEDAERQRREAEALAGLARMLTESLDVATMAGRVVDGILSIFNVPSAGLRLLQPDGSLMMVAAGGSSRVHSPPGDIWPAGAGVGGAAVAQGRAVWVRDQTDPDVMPLPEALRERVARAGLKAAMAAPLRAKGEILGAVVFHDDKVRDFSESEVALVQAVADHGALALQNARLREEAETRRREAEQLAALARRLTERLDVQAIARQTVASVLTLFEVSGATVQLLRGDDTLDTIAVELSPALRPHGASVLEVVDSLARRAVERRRNLSSRDVVEDRELRLDPARRALCVRAGAHGMAAMLLRVEGRIIGVLSMVDERVRDGSHAEWELLQAVADQAALALHNARSLAAADERAQRLSWLSALTRRIAAAGESRAVFNEVAEAATTLLGARLAHVLVHDARHAVLRVQGEFAVPELPGPARSGELVVAPGEGISGAAFLARAAEYVPDVEIDARWQQAPEVARVGALHACAAIPLTTADRIVGVLRLLYTERKTFTSEERELMQLLADHAAVAIRNKETEEELRQVNAGTEQLLTSISWILIAVDGDDRVTRWNAAAETTFGIAAATVLGRPLATTGIPWEWEPMLLRIADCREPGQAGSVGEVRYQRPNGKEGFLSVTVAPLVGEGERQSGLLLLGTDITERRLLEMQLVQAQKLESIGQLAAGVAHEINTPIQFVGDNVRFLSDALTDLGGVLERYRAARAEAIAAGTSEAVFAQVGQAEAQADVDYLLAEIPRAVTQTLEGIDRVATIVRAMKEFAHPDSSGSKVLADVNQLIGSTLTVARNEIKYVADVETELGELPPVACLPGDLNQVFLNLIVNAAHAIGDVVKVSGGRGRIAIRTRRDGDEVVISVADTGGGIPERIRTRIFDPFFTTKEVGRGTGQGLSIARSVVVDKHGGALTFETEIGQGTTFLIRLPIDGEPR